ncbi:MAG: glycosyltransferase family 4 protein [Holosporales bacterium]
MTLSAWKTFTTAFHRLGQLKGQYAFLRATLGKLWWRIPAPTRRKLITKIGALSAPKIESHPPQGIPHPMTVVGMMTSITGLGEGARLNYELFQKLGLPTHAFDVTSVFRETDLAFQGAIEAIPGGPGTLTIHLNAPQIPLVLGVIGKQALREKKVIGYWAWEQERVPAHWALVQDSVHEVWTCSQFVADAVKARLDVPVRAFPHPVRLIPGYEKWTRADFGLPADKFIVYSVFHMGSLLYRKNPLAVVRAYAEAMGRDDDACLVLSVKNPQEDPKGFAQLQAELASLKNVILLTQTLSSDQILGLTNCVDVVVSLHRAEGFGLSLAEAMLLGKPVVATGWSGNLEFMNIDNSALVDYTMQDIVDPTQTYHPSDGQWAEPDVAHAAHWLRQLKDDQAMRLALGEAARKSAEAKFAPENYYELLGLSAVSERF